MKKLLTLFAVFALTAPVFAADPNVAITCEDLGSGLVQVSYEVLVEDGVDPGLMRGLAFDVTTSNGFLIDAISDYATASGPTDVIPAGYSVFMGSIQFAADPNFVANFGDPVAPAGPPNNYPDTLGGLGTTGITVEMGSLYPEGGTAPAASGPLFKLQLSDPGSAGTCDLTIVANATRGSCVMEDGTPANLVSGGCTITIVSDCMASTNPDYNEWKNVGKPDCWCYERQCRGDALGDIEFNAYWVFQNDLAVFRGAFGKNPLPNPATDICADFAHDIEFNAYRVFQNDLAIFRTWFGKNPVPPCSGPGSGNDENPLPNSEFNFWVTP